MYSTDGLKLITQSISATKMMERMTAAIIKEAQDKGHHVEFFMDEIIITETKHNETNGKA